MRKLFENHPNLTATFAATVFGVVSLSYLSEGFTQPLPENVLMRLAFLAALYLLYIDVLAGTQLARRQRAGNTRANTLIFAFYMGYFWTVGMVLMFWTGIEEAGQLLAIFGAGGLFFGTIMAALPAKWSKTFDRYDTEKSIFNNGLTQAIYYLWPLILVATIAGLLAYPPTDGWRESYFLFQLIFLGSLMQPYGRKPTSTLFGSIARYWPKLLGTVFLMVGLFAHHF